MLRSMNVFIDVALIKLGDAQARYTKLEQQLAAVRLEIFDLAANAGEAVSVCPTPVLPPIAADRFAFMLLEEALSDAAQLAEQFGFVPAPFVVLTILQRGGAVMPWECPESAILAIADFLRALR